MFKKHFRIIKEDRVTGILPYVVQQRYTILFFIHWWSTPMYAPPHLFDSPFDAEQFILNEYPTAVIHNPYKSYTI